MLPSAAFVNLTALSKRLETTWLILPDSLPTISLDFGDKDCLIGFGILIVLYSTDSSLGTLLATMMLRYDVFFGQHIKNND